MAKHLSFDMSYLMVHSVLPLVFSSFAMLAVFLRFWARRIQKVALELNDFLIVLGLV